MKQDGEVKDILVLAFLREGLDMRNRDLIEEQKKVAMSLLAHRHDIIARKRAYRAFILLERGIQQIIGNRLLNMVNHYTKVKYIWHSRRLNWNMAKNIPACRTEFFTI